LFGFNQIFIVIIKNKVKSPASRFIIQVIFHRDKPHHLADIVPQLERGSLHAEKVFPDEVQTGLGHAARRIERPEGVQVI